MSENFKWREQLKTNFKINLLFSILWANPQGVTRAQMSQISGDVPSNRSFSTMETYWQKRNSNTLFDVTMGSCDGAETCELVGCYLLSQLKQIPDIDIGLYRDDGLAVFTQNPQKIEKVKKEICKIFARNDLRITIEANKKIVNFLDVTFDLNTGKFKPYSKPTTTPLYVHSK